MTCALWAMAYLALGAIVIEPFHLRGRSYFWTLVFWMPLGVIAHFIDIALRIAQIEDLE